jgi:hypothetical protein
MSAAFNKGRFVPPIERAHDVRKLRVCRFCDALGHADYMLLIDGGQNHIHGSCYIESHSMNSLIALPITETDKLCLADIGPNNMRALLAARQNVMAHREGEK